MFAKGFRNILFREIRRIFTTRDLLLMCFAAPLLYGIVLSSIYAGRQVQDVKVGVVNQDNTSLSRAFVRAVDATQNVDVFSSYRTGSEAVDAMVRGEVSGLLYIPSRFSADIKRGKDSTCLVSIDSSNIIVANPVMQSLLEVSNTFSSKVLAQTLMKKGVRRAQAVSMVQPLVLVTESVANPALNYSDFMLPGLLLVVLQQILLVGLGYTVAEEREHGRGGELLELADGNHLALLFGKILPYAAVNFLLGLLFLFVMLPVFGVSAGASALPALCFMALFILAMTAFGVMISSFFKSVAMALIVLMFYSMPTFLISGFSWPLFAMPLPVRAIAFLFPSTYFLPDFRLLVLMHAPLRCVFPSALALCAFTVVCLAITYVSFLHLFRRRGIL